MPFLYEEPSISHPRNSKTCKPIDTNISMIMLARSRNVSKFILMAFVGDAHTYVKYNVVCDFFLDPSIHVQAERKSDLHALWLKRRGLANWWEFWVLVDMTTNLGVQHPLNSIHQGKFTAKSNTTNNFLTEQDRLKSSKDHLNKIDINFKKIDLWRDFRCFTLL